MKRFLTIALLIIVLIVVITVPFIIWGDTTFALLSDQEKGITDFLLVSLELIGLVVSIAIVVIILYQYIRYRRPYRLVFDAFSNESTLVKNGDKPLNLSILAKEELIRQFKIIYYELKEYRKQSDKEELKEYRKQSDKEKQDAETQVADVLYSMEDLSRNNIEIFVSVNQIKKSGMVEDLEDVFKILTDPEDINLMNLVGEIAPKEVTPVMKFIEAIFPPHVIRATGHLQTKSDKPGITFEFVDLGNQRNLLVRTLWWEPSAQSKTTDNYIYLLSPAMHWVAIMFWEQKLLSHVPFRNRIPIFKDREDREKKRQARILYLLGALYYAHAEQFQAYRGFFHKLAVEHLYQALTKDSNWYLPYRYLANLYIFKAREKALETEVELRKSLFSEAFSLYDKALYYAQSKSLYTQHRIIIDKALAELVSGDDMLIYNAKQKVKDIIAEKDPADYDSAHPEWAASLSNLAIWYELSLELKAGVHNAKEEARRYLAYSLARPQGLWNSRYLNEHFSLLHDDGDLEVLQKVLREKLHEKPELATMTGDNFKSEIDMILKVVDQKFNRPGR